MHIGKSYKLLEFIDWTRRDVYLLTVLGIVPVLAYQVGGQKWLGIPWTVAALLGTATAFIVGFKNLQTYNRAWEARQIWGDILSASRAWGIMSRDFFNNPDTSRELVYRHLAWLTAMRYEMRAPKPWESTSKPHILEYQRQYYSVPETETSLEAELAKYLSPADLQQTLAARNKATQIMGRQSMAIKELFAKQEMVVLQFVDMQRSIKDLLLQQGRSERIKDFPYPRQFATINAIFVRLFCVLLPFALLREFDRLNESVEGVMKGNMIWLVIPFSMLISWVYTSLERVGESTENPFEGNANDVPISQICRTAERDLRELLGETDLPPSLQPKNNIVL
ncbi:MAG TPA: bestrophin family ion channel [Ramlibacter sp.]|nr:bestrophin family ion channel [Ramlibacter sp.]